ncbi:unnamed protein product [Orchesella dallaii]|uniref:Failed axon connections n=1 Tax=Orchesella dallaii TaxID=48710 RepID=A0ABP1S609_9HEXA
MSKLPSKNAFGVVPASAAISQQQTVDEAMFETIERFLRTPYFRRVSIAAGLGSVVFAAWYIIHKISVGSQPIPAPTPSLITAEEAAASATIHQDHDHLVEAPPEDEKVVIHCCPRGYFTPCIATAPLHLETFLRVANIPYEVSFCSGLNGHQIPFMTLGDKTADDFRGCIRILSEKYDVDLEKDASASRKTASHLIDVMLDNQFSWGVLIWRWIFDDGKSLKKIQPINSVGEEVVGDVAEQVKEATRFQPIGRLDRDEFVKTLFQGIQDISAALGKHPYFMGPNPGIVDCHAFAILSQLMWNMPDSPFETQIRRYSNLVDFVRRMRDNYWPDWNQLIDKPEEYEALSLRDESISRQTSEERLKRRKSSRSQGRVRDTSRGCKVERIPGSDNEQLKKKKPDDSQGKPEEDKETESSKPEHSAAPTPAEKSGGDAPDLAPSDVKNDESQSKQKEEWAPVENKPSAVSGTAPINGNAQPVGILKSGNVAVAKQRSALVNGSGANTNLTCPEILPNSEPTLSNQKQQPQLSQQVRKSPATPAQRPSPPPPTVSQKAEEQLQKQQQKSHPLHQDSVFQVHKPSVKFADNATASVVFAMDDKPETDVTENTKNSPSYTISKIASPTKTSEIPIRKAAPEPIKKAVAVILPEKQFTAKRILKDPIVKESEGNNQAKPETNAADNIQMQSLKQQHYQQHMGNLNHTQQQPSLPPSQQSQQQYQPPRQQQQQQQVPPQHLQQSQSQPSPQQQYQTPRQKQSPQFPQMRQQSSSSPQQQQQQQQLQRQQQQSSPNQNIQQPPRINEAERVVSVNAVNNNVMLNGPSSQQQPNNFENIQMGTPPQMQENIQHAASEGNHQFYAQRPQQMQQGYRPQYARSAMYAPNPGTMYPSPPQMRYGAPMSPQGMSMYTQMPLEEFQKAQQQAQVEAYYQEYQYQNGMLPSSYVVADMSPSMLQRFY